MEFEWDDAKSDQCFRTRGFDFAFAARAFFDPARTVEADARRNYGEDRYRIVGNIGGRLYVVFYTPRQDITRIISAHKANQRENKRYEDSSRQD